MGRFVGATPAGLPVPSSSYFFIPRLAKTPRQRYAVAAWKSGNPAICGSWPPNADPGCWPDGRKVDAGRRANHLEEIERFGQEVANDEVQLIACSYRELLTGWKQAESALLRRHARAVEEWAVLVD